MNKRIATIALSLQLMGLALVPPSQASSGVPGANEVRFERRWIKLGSHRLHVEIADTNEKRARGLMFRRSLAKNTGMLFIFPGSDVLTFWMKNTLIPLSIGFFDQDKTLLGTAEMVPAPLGSISPPTTSSPGPARYALEMPAGWFRTNGVKTGARFRFISN
jgi:hypothetical protein